MIDQRLYFESIESPKIKNIFTETLSHFPELKTHKIILRKNKKLKASSMRAQPVFDLNLFSKNNRAYKVEISGHLRLSKIINVDQVPEAVLRGWFAHELGHIMDYRNRSIFSLISFLIGYLFFPNSRRGAERQADLFAIEKGFSQDLIITKNYILNNSDLPAWYTRNIRKYYLSPDEVEAIILKNEKRDGLVDIEEVI